MKKLNLITILIFLSLNVTANEEVKEDIKDTEIQILEDKLSISSIENSELSIKKSDLRNNKSVLELKNQYLDQLIITHQKQQEVRKLEFLLNLPVEATMDLTKLNLKPEEKKPDGFEITEESLNFKSFEPQTYEIDQIVFSEPKKEPKKTDSNVSDNVQSVSNDDAYIQNALTIVAPPTQSLFDNKVVELLNTPNDPVAVSDSVQLEEELTDAELALLGITREQYKSWLTIPKEELVSEDVSVKKDDVKKEYLEIKQVNIDKTFIFGDVKLIDLSMNIYVGDGVLGETTTKEFRSIKEGSVIVFKDYKMKINNITSTEVEIENLSNGKVYVASNF